MSRQPTWWTRRDPLAEYVFQFRLSLHVLFAQDRPALSLGVIWCMGGGGGGGHEQQVLDPKRDEANAEAIRARLLEKRERWRFAEGDDMAFYIRIQGGEWTDEFAGEEADSAVCFARAAAKKWCDRFKWPKQRGFWFSRYGVEDSNQLAREWARRGHYYFSLAAAHCDPDKYIYSEEDLAGYPPNLDFVAWAVDLANDSASFDEVVRVAHAQPTNPP